MKDEKTELNKKNVLSNLKGKTGTLKIQTDSTDTISYNYTFKIVDGKAVSGVYNTFFEGEYSNQEKSTNVEKFEEELHKLLSYPLYIKSI